MHLQFFFLARLVKKHFKLMRNSQKMITKVHGLYTTYEALLFECTQVVILTYFALLKKKETKKAVLFLKYVSFFAQIRSKGQH